MSDRGEIVTVKWLSPWITKHFTELRGGVDSAYYEVCCGVNPVPL